MSNQIECKATLPHKCRACDVDCPYVEALNAELAAWDQLSDEAWDQTLDEILEEYQGAWERLAAL